MPKLLWVSPLSVHDTASVSAMQMRNMLLSLKSRNIDIVALSALNFTRPEGTSLFTDLDEKLKSNENSFNLNDNDINFIYIKTQSRNLGQMISQEQRNFYAKLCAIINTFRPDVVMGAGTDMLSMVCFDEAKRRGIPTAYVLLDGTPDRFNFPNIDLVLTDSNAVSQLYANQHKINSVVVGSFLPIEGPLSSQNLSKLAQELAQKNNTNQQADGRTVITVDDIRANLDTSRRNRITFINPTINSGLSIFARLAQVGAKELKNEKFAVLELQDNQYQENLAYIHEKGSNKNAFNSSFKDIEVLDKSTPLSEVFATTKLLVVPSLNFESIVRYAREAVANGIPVLASNIAGNIESTGNAAVYFNAPDYCQNDFTCAPTKTDIAELVKVVKTMINEDYLERCVHVTQSFDITNASNNLAIALKPLFDKHAGHNPQILRAGSLI